MQPAIALSKIIEALYLVFFVSLACSFRAVSSIVIPLLLIAGLIKNWIGGKHFFNQNIKNYFLYGCVLLFLVHFLAQLYTNNKPEGWLDLQTKIGLALTPIAVCCAGFINNPTRKKLSFYFIIIIAAVSLYCLARAMLNYFQSGDLSFLFYHKLVQPVNGHAIYFSVLVFIALLILIESIARNNFILNNSLHVFFIVFYSVFLFLLSSKLVIGFYFLYLIVYFAGLVKNKSAGRFVIIGTLILFITGSTIILITPNPVSNRFLDIVNGDLKVVKKEKFNPGMYFNGVQFRMLQWKFSREILNENHGWWAGVGPGNVQHLLDQKYISSNMYVGEPARGDHGFLGYNTHNQFLETVLKTGIVGLAILLFTCFTLIKIAWQKKKREINFIIGLLLVWLFTESVLERQYGILIFTFFPFFIWLDEK